MKMCVIKINVKLFVICCYNQLVLYTDSIVSLFPLVGLMKKATMSAATFLTLEPSEPVMADNIKYYHSNLDIPEEAFTPRKVCGDNSSVRVTGVTHCTVMSGCLSACRPVFIIIYSPGH